MKVHELKTQYFEKIFWFHKTADLRLDDRGFEVGDIIHYKEWMKSGGYVRYGPNGSSGVLLLGRDGFAKITHIVSADNPCVESAGALKDGYVILSIKVQNLVDA